ncbi:MAG: FAD-binding oxidoreductase [Methanobacteriota archaeon]|nr:MAG: FAD-binding oxidoreductase [Euryarchaeota archaeon]
MVSDADLRTALEAGLGQENVLVDEASRHAYATDASPCVVEPRAIAMVRSEDDVLRTLAVCRELGVPVTPRASGTSLSGAAIGPGVILDTTRFARILELNEAQRWVRVQPGILLSELNARLRDRGLRFAPDPGSQDLCRIGGMIGHNASGYRSVKYGQTRDHVLGLRVALADGTVLEAKDTAIAGETWKDLIHQAPALETIRRAIEGNRTEILAARRPVRKHACGSTLRVIPLPERRLTLLLYLERFRDLGVVVADVLPMGPSALEAIDGSSLRLLDRDALGVPASAEAMLLIEFDEGDLSGIAKSIVEHLSSRYRLSRPIEVTDDPGRQATLWKVRRSLLPTIIQRPGRRKPWGFVEDPVVPRDRVPEFINFLVDLARQHGTDAGIYGHVGDGNTHFRPFFDPTDPEDFGRMQALRTEFDEAVLGRFRGAPSAEHGIGRIRAETLPKVWGPHVYRVMQTIKQALDPVGLLNPGVLLSDEPWWAAWGGLESRSPM